MAGFGGHYWGVAGKNFSFHREGFTKIGDVSNPGMENRKDMEGVGPEKELEIRGKWSYMGPPYLDQYYAGTCGITTDILAGQRQFSQNSVFCFYKYSLIYGDVIAKLADQEPNGAVGRINSMHVR